MKIAVQTGMHEIEQSLKAKGYEVVPYRESGMDIKIAILNDIDASYEEIDPVTFYGTEENPMVLIDASSISHEQVLVYVDKYAKQFELKNN